MLGRDPGHLPRAAFALFDEDSAVKILVTLISLALLSLVSVAQEASGAKSAGPGQSQASATPAPPAHPITAEQTRQLFELAGTKDMMEKMIRRTLSVQKASSPPYIPEDVWSDLEQSFLKVDFAQLLLPTYQRYLSQEDAEQALTFYRTPAGQHFLAVVPQVMIDAGDVGRKEGQRIAGEVLTRHQQEIMDAKKKYDEQQNTPGKHQQQAPPAGNKPDAVNPKAPQ
jgi:uncharacterized protein